MNVTRQELSYENPQLIGPNPMMLNLDFESFWREALRTGVADMGPESEPNSESLRETDRALVFDVPEFDGEGDLHLIVYQA